MRKADWLIGALIALLFFLGVSYFARTYNTIQNQNPDRPSVNETLNKTGEGETATLDEEDEYDDEEYAADGDTSVYKPDEPTIDDLTDLNATRGETTGKTDGSSPSGASESTPTSYSSSNSNGKYLVVAGTFQQEANAQSELRKFKKMGYSDVEIGKFNKSAYASLIVDRFSTSAEAKRLVRALKAKGIDAYVHKKR